jgi:hypothetical protein
MNRRLRSRLPLSALVGCLLVVVAASPASAQPRGSDDVVVLTGGAEVGSDEVVGNVVVFDGGAVVDGSVNDSVVSFNGDVTVTGQVDGDVVVFKGRAAIRDGAQVGGDVRTVQQARVEEGAEVRGTVGRINRVDFDDVVPFAFGARLAWWFAISVSTLVLGLLLLWLAPRLASAVAERATLGSLPAFGWGLLLFVGLPIVAVLALVTVVGIPFGLGLFSALMAIYAVGYVTSGWMLGQRLLTDGRSKYLVFVAGWAVLRVVALIPVVGGIVSGIATILGLGVLVTARRAAPSDRVREPAASRA